MKDISQKQMLDLIAALPDGEQKRSLIRQLVESGEISEGEVAAVFVTDSTEAAATYARTVAEDPFLVFLWRRFERYPEYLARALVRARPDIFYTYGFAFRLVMKLNADLGPVLIPPRRPTDDPPVAVYMKSLPELVQKDLLELDVECRFREVLFFMSRDPRLGFEFLEEAIAHAAGDDYDREVQTRVRDYCTHLLTLKFPGFISELHGTVFPSFHVRWWIDRINKVDRTLNIGDTGTHKTAFATLATHHYGCRKVLVLCPPHARPNWTREINAYFKKRDDGRVLLVRDRGMVESIATSDAQYVVIGYSTLIKTGVVSVLEEARFDGLIWDECQYGTHVTGSNPAERAKACAELIRSLPLKRLLALSATPWENEPSEFGAIAMALRPDVFPTVAVFQSARAQDPRFLREFFANNIVEVSLPEVRDLPPITPEPWRNLFGAELIDMSTEHREVYTRVREDEEVLLRPPQKVGRLLLATTHPNQVKKYYPWAKGELQDMFSDWRLSSKLVWLKERMTRELALGAKVVVATGIHVSGITRPTKNDQEEALWVGKLLCDWFGKDSVLILDGPVSQSVDRTGTSERDRLITRWRTNPEAKILVASMRACPDSVNLSIPALPGINKLFITALCYPWVPWKQFLGRFWRDGLGVPVEYTVPILRGTIDEALLRLITRKWSSQQLFRAQVPLTADEWKYLSRKIDLRLLAEEARSDSQKINIIGALVQGRGEDAAKRILADAYGTTTNGEAFARAFLAVQEYATSGHIARFMRPVLETFLAQGLTHAEGIFDAGCGPLTLERSLGLPVYGVDFNRHMLEFARAHSLHGGKNAEVRCLTELPKTWSKKFELTVVSLVLDWTAIHKRPGDKNIPERLRILSELVRVTHPYGRVWITATHQSMDERILEAWIRGLTDQGFGVIEGLTGLVRSVEKSGNGKRFAFWSLCFTPNGKRFAARHTDPFRFAFEHERVRVKRGGGGGEVAPPGTRRDKYETFEIVHQNGTVHTDSDAALTVATQEIERMANIPEGEGWRFHRPPSLELDWRQLVKLHQRGTLEDVLRRRGLL